MTDNRALTSQQLRSRHHVSLPPSYYASNSLGKDLTDNGDPDQPRTPHRGSNASGDQSQGSDADTALDPNDDVRMETHPPEDVPPSTPGDLSEQTPSRRGNGQRPRRRSKASSAKPSPGRAGSNNTGSGNESSTGTTSGTGSGSSAAGSSSSGHARAASTSAASTNSPARGGQPPRLKVVQSRSQLKPVVGRTPKARRLRPEGGFMSPLMALTTYLSSTYSIADPKFQYSQSKNPRRVLTEPHEPKSNNGFDNAENDYILHVNDILGVDENRRYLTINLLGKGTFGQVVKCQNMATMEVVAVKVIKNKPAFLNQSMMEVSVLEHIQKTVDRDSKHNLLRLKDQFMHKEHLCLVFELLSLNLYEVVKKNEFRGLGVNVVRTFTQQLLDSLLVLKSSNLIHCDLKPENILLARPDSLELKVIDFGSACHERQTVYSYIQSRFYRSPEVILGLPYTSAIDMWSLGCIVAELFLGLPIFPGSSEYNQWSRIQASLGLPPKWMLDKGKHTKNFMTKVYEDESETEEGSSPAKKAEPKASSSSSSDANTKASSSSNTNSPSKAKGPERPYHWRLRTLREQNAKFNTHEKEGKRYFASTNIHETIMTYPLWNQNNMTKEEITEEMRQREALSDFVHGLLNFNPFERWTPQQAVSHPFINQVAFRARYSSPVIVPQSASAALQSPLHNMSSSSSSSSTPRIVPQSQHAQKPPAQKQGPPHGPQHGSQQGPQQGPQHVQHGQPGQPGQHPLPPPQANAPAQHMPHQMPPQPVPVASMNPFQLPDGQVMIPMPFTSQATQAAQMQASATNPPPLHNPPPMQNPPFPILGFSQQVPPGQVTPGQMSPPMPGQMPGQMPMPGMMGMPGQMRQMPMNSGMQQQPLHPMPHPMPPPIGVPPIGHPLQQPQQPPQQQPPPPQQQPLPMQQPPLGMPMQQMHSPMMMHRRPMGRAPMMNTMAPGGPNPNMANPSMPNPNLSSQNPALNNAGMATPQMGSTIANPMGSPMAAQLGQFASPFPPMPPQKMGYRYSAPRVPAHQLADHQVTPQTDLGAATRPYGTQTSTRGRAATIGQVNPMVPAPIQQAASRVDPNQVIQSHQSPAYFPPREFY